MSNAAITKLDVTETVSAAYRRSLVDLRDYLLLAAPMFVFLLFGNYVQLSYMADILKRGAYFELDPRLGLIQLVGILLFAMMLANIARRTLLGSKGPRNLFGVGWGKREFRVLGRGLIVIGAIPLFNAFAFGITLAATANGRPPIWIFIILLFLPLASMVAIVFFCCRSCTYPIAPCLDADLGFREAFKSTRGNVLPIFGSCLLAALPFMIGSSVISVLVGLPTHLIPFDTYLMLSIPFITAVQMGFAIVFTVLLTLIYERLVLIPTASPLP